MVPEGEMSLGSSRKRDKRSDQKQYKYYRKEQKPENILKMMRDVCICYWNCSQVFFLLLFLVNDNSLWSYSKALAGRVIYPSSASVVFFN